MRNVRRSANERTEKQEADGFTSDTNSQMSITDTVVEVSISGSAKDIEADNDKALNLDHDIDQDRAQRNSNEGMETGRDSVNMETAHFRK